MTAWYNEMDPYAAQWLRNLVSARQIASGDVDERSIEDVAEDDLRGYSQCHFFAGIGGWSVALRLAGWPDDRPVWTGSCPCQPFSVAGKGEGAADKRHLWPHWFRLIRERRPDTIFGEQVDAAVGWGWVDAVFADLEAEDYAAGAAVLPACSVGAPHIRQRLWFVAHADIARSQGRLERGNGSGQWPAGETGMGGFWSDLEWLPCSDGKARPTQPGLFPLAHGIQRRTHKLRAYGNAITPQAAAEFIKAAIP